MVSLVAAIFRTVSSPFLLQGTSHSEDEVQQRKVHVPGSLQSRRTSGIPPAPLVFAAELLTQTPASEHPVLSFYSPRIPVQEDTLVSFIPPD